MLLVIVMFTSRVILLDSFMHIETDRATQHLERLNSAIMKEVSIVDSSCGDYATWDDTYRFMQNKNPGFIRDNLTDLSLGKLKIDFVSFVMLDGEEVFSKVANGRHITYSPYRDLKPYLFDGNKLVNTDGGIKGLIVSGGLPMFVSSRPVLTSEGKGPVSGVLIMGRILDGDELQSISELVRLPLSLAVPEKEASQPAISIKRPDTQTIKASYHFSDINGKPAFRVTADIRRDIYLEGDRTIKHFIYTILIGAGLISIVISRLSGRLTATEHDRQITDILCSAVVEASSSMAVIMDAETCRIIKSTPAVSRVLGYSPEQLHGVLFRELLHECKDSFESCRAAVYEAEAGFVSAPLKLRQKDGSIIAVNTEINSRTREGKQFLVIHFNIA